jgi:hypothetical protein
VRSTNGNKTGRQEARRPSKKARRVFVSYNMAEKSKDEEINNRTLEPKKSRYGARLDLLTNYAFERGFELLGFLAGGFCSSSSEDSSSSSLASSSDEGVGAFFDFEDLEGGFGGGAAGSESLSSSSSSSEEATTATLAGTGTDVSAFSLRARLRLAFFA